MPTGLRRTTHFLISAHLQAFLPSHALLLSLALLLLSACRQAETPPAPVTPGKTTRLEWFREAKFGMFIHWGPYSQLAGEWNGRQVPVGENAEWAMQKLEIPREEYRALARQFNPTRFDAEAWAQLAQDAGMKYLIITAKHHDGFAMYDSKVSDYNIVDHTPFNRDPLQELAAACRQRGIRFGLYYSHREDWDEPYAYGNTWDFSFDPPDSLALFEQRYLYAKAKPQVEELLAGFDSLAILWFDRGLYTPEQAQEFIGLIRRRQPWCLINGRVGHYEQELLGDYQNMNDNGMPPGGIEEYWETPQTLNDTWGYSRFDHNWKSAADVIEKLAAVASRGGNYLLNVGPTGEGEIPQESVQVLKRVGRWMQANSESIYGTTASPFLNIPWGYCTVKGSRLYLHVFEPPEDGTLILEGLTTPVTAARLLAAPQQKLPFVQDGATLRFRLPATLPDTINTVLVAELAGPPEVLPPVVRADETGAFTFDHYTARTFGATVKRFNRKGKFHLSRWAAPADSARWHFDAEQPQAYELSVTYAARPEWAGQPYAIRLGGLGISAQVQGTGDWYEYQTFVLDTVVLSPARRIELTIHPAEKLSGNLMYFKALELKPFR
ncbi:MAG: alpha-L-fucosidase [Phaeodactylibacter sp.]|nr:alpha-L-fucosidase [Phaeodactylibacter sp.]